MIKTNEISVVCPVYGCRESLAILCVRLQKTLRKLSESHEIILVDDNCPNNSWEIIEELCKADNRIKGIKFSRNFGQHYAITAGLDHANGKWIVVMDCDLQDQPEEIIKLYEKTKDGYDIVVGQRIERRDPFLKRVASKAFYRFLEYCTDLTYDASVANFGIYSQKVIKNVNLYRERNRAFPLFVNLVGFRRTSIPIEHSNRESGSTSYTIRKMIDLATDIIVSYSNKPLRVSIKLGLLISLISLCYAIWLIIRYFLFSIPIIGWTSMMVVMLFMFGILFGSLGILGLYIGKIFDETKDRPLYVIDEIRNLYCPDI